MSGSSFTVTNTRALHEQVDPLVKGVADQVAGDARTRTPKRTGTLAAGWTVAQTSPGHYLISNPVRHGKYVEYGTRKMRGSNMFGTAIAWARARYGR